MYNLKFLIVLILLIGAIIIILLLPKNVPYQGSNIISELQLPLDMPGWSGRDVSYQLNTGRYDDISEALAYNYQNNAGNNLIFIVLDVANFHFPNNCLTRAGYDIRELDKTEISTHNRVLKAHTVYSSQTRDQKHYMVFYWIVIDKTLTTNWVQQKFKQLLFSLFGKNRVALMARIDVPVQEGNIEDGIKLASKFVNDLSSELPTEYADFIFGKVQ